MARQYRRMRPSSPAARNACLNVAEYSKLNPCSARRARLSIHSSPPAPRWPSSTSTRLFPSKLSTATVVFRFSSFSLVTSMISMLFPANSPRPSGLKISADRPDISNSSKCCRLNPSLGVSRMIRFSSPARPCLAR